MYSKTGYIFDLIIIYFFIIKLKYFYQLKKLEALNFMQ
jgi:hypothetical protein